MPEAWASSIATFRLELLDAFVEELKRFVTELGREMSLATRRSKAN